MLTGELAEFLATTLDKPAASVLERLKPFRATGLLSKRGRGPRSGARMTSHDAVIATLANALECPRGSSPVDVVQQAFNLSCESRIALPQEGFVDGLTSFWADTAGEALVALIDDIRVGRLDTWAVGEAPYISVTLDARGESLAMSIWLPKRHETDVRNAMQTFGPNYDENQPVTRQVSFRTSWFVDLARSLGPP
jgi:hypothetical protein